MKNTLSVHDLSIGYLSKKEDTVLARNLNFSLKQGELTALVGINGIGKSTLLRTIGKVQPALSGSIKIKDVAISGYNLQQLAMEISLVLTEPLASKNLTVLELVSLGRTPYTNWLGNVTEIDKTAINCAIAMVELQELQHKKCHQLSDGQLQRVMIARALAQETPIILLDEPTSHLDMHHKVQLLKLLRHISKNANKTIVFTTHEIEMAIQLCDTMLLLDGKTNLFGTPEWLIKQNAFNNLFPSNSVLFDATNGTFKIQV